MASITSANAVLLISIANLYPVAQRIEHFATDDMYDLDNVEVAEAQMGVDGHLTAGFVYNPYKWTIHLQADSVSFPVFDAWRAAMRSAREVYWANGMLRLKSINRAYTLTRGVLTTGTSAPSGKKVLQARSYEIAWESISIARIGA